MILKGEIDIKNGIQVPITVFSSKPLIQQFLSYLFSSMYHTMIANGSPVW